MTLAKLGGPHQTQSSYGASKLTRPQDNDGINSLFDLTRESAAGTSPPVNKTVIFYLWCNSLQTKLLQDAEPKLLGENTRDQQVINCFSNLITKWPFQWVVKVSLASLSALQHRLWARVYMKNLHYPGAQLFQILSHESN